MPDSTQDVGFFSERMPDHVKDLIYAPFESDATTLGRLSRVNAHTRAFVQPQLEKLLLAKSLVFGASALVGYRDDLIDEILGIPGNWRVTDDAMLVVARTFSAFRPGFSAPVYPPAEYPPNWRDLAPFRKVHDWWEWACDTDVHLALRVDLLSFLLLAGELFLAHINNNLERDWDYGRFYWKSDELEGGNFTGAPITMFCHRYSVNGRRNPNCRRYKLECVTHEHGEYGRYPLVENMEPTLKLMDEEKAVSVPTTSTINEWALNIMAELEDDPNFYDDLALPPNIETTGAVVKSLHAGPKTLFKRELPYLSLENCDILI